MKALQHPWLAFFLRLALAAVFLWAGVGKAMDPHNFGLEIARYRMVPHDLLNIMAITLPWMELLCGATLLVGLWTRANAVILAGMLVVFIIAIVSALQRGLDISCGCFGGGAESSHLSQATLWRDLFWLSWALHVVFFDRGVLGVDGWLARRQGPMEVKP